MRGAWLAGLALLSCLACPAGAQEWLVHVPPATPPSQPPAPLPVQGGADADLAGDFLLTGEFLFLRPNRDGMTAAVVSRTSDGWTSSSVESLSWDGTPGFRVGGRYLLPESCLEVGATFTYFHASTQRTIAAAADGSLLGTLATDRDARNAASADAAAGLSYAVLDLDAGKSARLSDSLAVRAFGGVRLASIDQSLKAIYSGGALGGGFDYVNSPIRFRGAGLTAGGEANWALYGGWGFYGRGRLGLLSARFDSDFHETAGGSLVNDQSERYFTVIPVTELGAGLSYQGGFYFFSLGYEVTDYLNVVSGIGGPGPNGGITSRRRGDLTLEALSLRAGFSF